MKDNLLTENERKSEKAPAWVLLLLEYDAFPSSDIAASLSQSKKCQN